MRCNFFIVALAIATTTAAYTAGNIQTEGTTPQASNKKSWKNPDRMKIKLTIKDQVLTATLKDNRTAQDFVSLLPLTLTMNDLFGREKFGHLPRAISDGGERTHSYQVGQIVYWSPGPDVAIFYRHDGQSIPDPGIIVLGKIDSGVEALTKAQASEMLTQLAFYAGWPNVFSAIPVFKGVFEKRPK
jgi:hypothetical protein